jgi:abhydrolase domain-containing protein 6
MPPAPAMDPARHPPLILINGLAEQAESWSYNLAAWQQHFEVHTPNLLDYEGTELHRRISAGQAIDVDYLVGRLQQHLARFVRRPPYSLVANSLGGKVALEFTARYPDQVSRLVLLCPSGLSDHEQLPLTAGVRRHNLQSLVASVFFNPRHADPGIVATYEKKFANRRWRLGLLRTIRGTMDHCIRDRLADITHPTMLVVGREDRIVNPDSAIEASTLLSDGKLVVLDKCGHAPQLEQAERINRLVIEFLQGPAGLTVEARQEANR